MAGVESQIESTAELLAGCIVLMDPELWEKVKGYMGTAHGYMRTGEGLENLETVRRIITEHMLAGLPPGPRV